MMLSQYYIEKTVEYHEGYLCGTHDLEEKDCEYNGDRKNCWIAGFRVAMLERKLDTWWRDYVMYDA